MLKWTPCAKTLTGQIESQRNVDSQSQVTRHASEWARLRDKSALTKLIPSRAGWCKPLIPALRRLMQQDHVPSSRPNLACRGRKRYFNDIIYTAHFAIGTF